MFYVKFILPISPFIVSLLLTIKSLSMCLKRFDVLKTPTLIMRLNRVLALNIDRKTFFISFDETTTKNVYLVYIYFYTARIKPIRTRKFCLKSF